MKNSHQMLRGNRRQGLELFCSPFVTDAGVPGTAGEQGLASKGSVQDGVGDVDQKGCVHGMDSGRGREQVREASFFLGARCPPFLLPSIIFQKEAGQPLLCYAPQVPEHQGKGVKEQTLAIQHQQLL